MFGISLSIVPSRDTTSWPLVWSLPAPLSLPLRPAPPLGSALESAWSLCHSLLSQQPLHQGVKRQVAQSSFQVRFASDRGPPVHSLHPWSAETLCLHLGPSFSSPTVATFIPSLAFCLVFMTKEVECLGEYLC